MDLEAIKKGIIETVKGRSKKLLEESAEARNFLDERARDIARLVVMLSQAGDEYEEEEIKRELQIARQAAENEIASVMLDAEAEAKATFKEVIATIFEFVEKALPSIIALL
jgi:H2-forming N5,N10-methylenetetrahydromethanopterin dehydrogenase-like enzyme